MYLLFLNISRDTKIRVGSLGLISFPAGVYVYVGSAQNSVEARIKRHLNKKKTLRWHIDYLTSSEDVEPIYAVVLPLTRNYECRIAKILQENDSISINNFGASDCRCKSHLYNIKSPSRLIMKIKRTLNLKKPIKCMKIYGDFTIR
ncbi:MAG: GIY-YIG nuclease family protein [Thaumarchaeota archaeon]|nr:GIY-YIG nuclease family protein [Candidatus Geocrenenecus arthurdayi]MCL7396992.1 GIY-YIG nuclease family protein [Candidatus Geocrenenecus arthurdayi]MCL7404043.1 GIY-YIG nuclease family protein [Candidatus Geocrenenecus arthurdayi]